MLSLGQMCRMRGECGRGKRVRGKGIRKILKISNAASCILVHRRLLNCHFDAIENNHLNGDRLQILHFSS